MMRDEDHSETPSMDTSRRRLLTTALAGSGAALAATVGAAQPEISKSGQGPVRSASTDWNMMFDLTVRIPASSLNEWNSFWGEGKKNAALLEENGQWLWGAWRSLTGQQDTITHQWAYRDLAHYQDMGKMRLSNPRVLELTRYSVPIKENMQASIMTPLPYHPKSAPDTPAGQIGIIATHRIYNRTPGDGTAAHSRLMADHVAVAAKHGAQIVGAFESFFGWTPPYLLQVWRYPSIEQYWASRRAIEADPEGKRLLAELRDIFPHETVDLNQPTPYSRIR